MVKDEIILNDQSMFAFAMVTVKLKGEPNSHIVLRAIEGGPLKPGTIIADRYFDGNGEFECKMPQMGVDEEQPIEVEGHLT